jgi:spermidine synthase
MIPRRLIDTALIPGTAGEDGDTLRLFQRGAEYSIMLGANELMNSRLSGSEEALATLSCDIIASCSSPCMLIGGLGMGFTLRAALESLGDTASIVVAELVPAVVEWAHGPMRDVHGDSLVDMRVTIEIGDVGEWILRHSNNFDAILLDVDNGPDGLTRTENDRLYGPTGLRAAWNALRPGGVLSVWSSAPDAAFAKRLDQAGFRVTEHVVKAHKGRSGARHVIWCAVRP